MAKEKWVPTPERLRELESYVKERLTEREIAVKFRLSSTAWYQKKNEYPELQEVIDDARKQDIRYVMGKLWKIINNEDHKSHATCVMFYLNKYDKQEQTTTVSVTGSSDGIVFRVVTPDDVKRIKNQNGDCDGDEEDSDD